MNRDTQPLVIRRGGPADAVMLAALGARTFHDTFGPDNRPEDMAAYMAQAYGEAQQRRELLSSDGVVLIGEVDGAPAAYAYVRRAAPRPGVDQPASVPPGGTVEIARFYVDTPFHGRGIANAMMDAAIAEAVRRGGATIWLAVWERNARAIRFYEKSGFVDIGSQTFQLGGDLQHDRVMARPLAAPVGRLDAIWVKRMKRGPMDPVAEANLVAGKGIRGNANQGGRRQVTIIERELWDTVMTELAAHLAPASRRANLMVNGLSLAGMRGRVLRVGQCRIRIYSETKPCYQMEDALPGLESAMQPAWRGGAFGEVLDDGDIRVGDTVAFELASPA